jgi:N,N'-diacetyllegionaminate synthase
MTVIGKRQIGDDHPCFITFEAGPTHDGVNSAKRLIKYASDAGGDAVKFQIFDPDLLVADRKQLFTYSVLIDKESGETEEISEPLYDILCRRCLDYDEWRDLKAYSDSLGLAFFSTVAFESDIDLLVDIGCDSIKIASADVNHLPLIRYAARTGQCIQLDTGNASLDEIGVAVDAIRSEGNENIIIHQCPSGYPARLESINLKIIPTLKDKFKCPAAFSDHTPGWEMDVAAVALGANLVEKTITEDRTTRSVEHVMSLEPSDMSDFVRVIRDTETALGQSERILAPEELERRKAIRRSLHLTSAVSAGMSLRDASYEFRRPGTGVEPDRYEIFLDYVFQTDLPAGHRLQENELTPS